MANPIHFEPSESFAFILDQQDTLRAYRDRFSIPLRGDGTPAIYFCGHSLGLQPRTVKPLMEQELDDWARLGVKGHFQGQTPWYSYHELVRESAARLIGAKTNEVIAMNSLTVNLHLMMATFYRPAADRYKILMDEPAFPSDLYAVKSQIALAGYDAADALLTVGPASGKYLIPDDAFKSALSARGSEIALVLLNGINFLSGQLFDLQRIARWAKERGCLIGLDLAHCAGNVILDLHDWGVDFAVWCNYKYLNGGPGAVGGCFVHERHGNNLRLPRLAGWWGNDPATRFRMQLETEFVPQPGADGWQVSNPPIFSLVPVRASYAIYDDAGIPALRGKSVQLTNYLLYLIDELDIAQLEVITPRESHRRGSQLSLRIADRVHEVVKALDQHGVVVDFRQPDIIRVAPVPLYNTFHDVWVFAQVLKKVLG